ncbi:hypothetical protein BU17DRAFT_60387 [Hysterangium stoloniferum]|nr:hypothetical protein BU17DRAFT_60387 [Hysterangium stoloniferum]
MSRETGETKDRPIIFIAHSLGGIILKSALIEANVAHEGHLMPRKWIHLSTYGIVFLGTPHQGIDMLPFSLCSRPNNILLKYLTTNSEPLQQQISHFNAITAHFHMKFFYETLPTSLPVHSSAIIVPKASAILPGAVNIEPISMHKDHTGMSKFQSVDDDDYKSVLCAVQDMIKKAPATVDARHTETNIIKQITTPKDLYTCPSTVLVQDGTNAETLIKGISSIANDPEAKSKGIEKSQESVLSWLTATKKKCLIIFDNADGMDGAVKEYLEQTCQIYVLITSRNPGLASHVTDSLEVLSMESDQALALFQAAAKFDKKSNTISKELLKMIVTQLGFLPLAIDIAGAAISTGLCGVTEYLMMHEKYHTDIFDADNPSMKGAFGYNHSVYSTLRLSYDLIEKQAISMKGVQDALFVLKVLGYFHHQNIMESIFKQAAEFPPANTYDEKLQTTSSDLPAQLLRCNSDRQWESLKFRIAMQVLCDYSLLTRDPAAQYSYSWTMYPMIQMWIRSQALGEGDTLHYYAARALIGVAKAKKEGYYDYAGKWFNAELLQIQVVENREQILGTEHPDTLTARANLAVTYHQLGRWTDAEQLEVQVLEASERILGTEHPETLTARANLAITYHQLGRWTDGEQLQVQVLEVTRANLAVTYHQLGRWTDAEQLEVQVLEAREQILGTEHPDPLRARASLAGTYSQLGKWTDAEQLQVQVLEAREWILGTEHPNTLTARANMAATYHQLGRWTGAEQLEVQLLEASEQILGTEHPDTLTARANLAVTYCQLGRWTDAEQLEVLVLEPSEQILGTEHPDSQGQLGCYISLAGQMD